jgi:hypothetical protein
MSSFQNSQIITLLFLAKQETNASVLVQTRGKAMEKCLEGHSRMFYDMPDFATGIMMPNRIEGSQKGLICSN